LVIELHIIESTIEKLKTASDKVCKDLNSQQ